MLSLAMTLGFVRRIVMHWSRTLQWGGCWRRLTAAPQPLVGQSTSTVIHVNEMTMFTADCCSCAALDPRIDICGYPQFSPLVATDIPVWDDLADLDRIRLVRNGPIICRLDTCTLSLVCDINLVYRISSCRKAEYNDEWMSTLRRLRCLGTGYHGSRLCGEWDSTVSSLVILMTLPWCRCTAADGPIHGICWTTHRTNASCAGADGNTE